MDPERKTSYPLNKLNVLLLEGIDPLAGEAFKKAGFPVELLSGSLSEADLIKKIPQVSILGIRSRTQVPPGVVANSRKLLAVGAYCIGTEQIDLEACRERGAAVFNDPLSNTRSVVELALGDLIMLERGAADKSAQMHRGIWNKSANGAVEIRGKKFGIIGYGNIGKQLSVLVESLGMEVGFYDTAETLAMGNAKKYSTMTGLLGNSDVVSVHVSGDPKNENLISENEFQAMKDGAIFLNLSRGRVVDLEALARHISSGKLKGAAIDVFPTEPKSNGDKFESPLQGLPNVILTPHIGGSTEEAQRNIAKFVTSKLINFINNGDTTMSVNWPQLQLSPQDNVHRFLHYHRNEPGVLAAINRLLGERDINISQQYLKTEGNYGYAVVDVNTDYDPSLIKDLRKVPQTIKFRPLY
jgi:D-3-phosphoglycerate dehydrogenase / 2-oxoglutarate reductase